MVESSSIGRSKIYEDIKSKKLKAKKNGKRTLITIFDAIEYLESLPEMEVE
ncbi:MAG: DNA-binding protein [gamma proteobacterium symbiont of Taylorina sp.]|nr:DNA-binding protein [gamma proteobacterium symbiont of Taylorina sp.]